MNLANKVAIVTGAGRGIGKATAVTLAREGANVVVNDIDGKAAQQVATEIESMGHQALAIKADVSQSKEVNRMIQSILEKFSKFSKKVNFLKFNFRT